MDDRRQQESQGLGVVFKPNTRITDALAHAREAAAQSPHDADAHYNLGAVLQGLNRLDEAEASYRRALQANPRFAEAHYNLGLILQSLGRLDGAEASYRKAIEANPAFAEAHYNLGVLLQSLGRPDQAEASYRQALQVNPDFAEAHCNLGNAVKELGRPEEAEIRYRRALEISPDFIEAHINLGNTLKDLGRIDEAEAGYRRLLQITPDFAEAHYNLGNILKDLGRIDEAEASFRHALEIRPEFVDAMNNLALLLNARGEPIAALGVVRRSLQTRETAEGKSLFVRCVNRVRFTRDDSEIRALMVRALTEPWCRPGELARIGIELVKLNADLGARIARAADAWPLRRSARDLFRSDDLAALAADPLLRALLISAPMGDIAMERFLTIARLAMLEAALETPAPDGEAGTDLRFCGALARQCFVNEYVFSHTDDEIQDASALRDSLAAALEAKTRMPALWPVAVAAYFPLYTLPLAERLLDRHWPEEVVAVLTQQVRDPAEERQLRAAIPRLSEIEDAVSLQVQRQYEEHPYPCWVKTAPIGQARNFVEYLCQKFPLASFNRRGKGGRIDLLIAGCGTGQHSIETAQIFQGAQVLAVDLSLTSLGYAKRKTRELGVASIEYAQADLLKLGSLGRSFDIVESSGVLHHLADPWAGWRVLLSLLRPGGFMKLGFYSEVARRNIAKVRAFMAKRGYGSTSSEIRRCRQDLMALDGAADLGSILRMQDFFSTSSCRDLLFHVQEHRMTLGGIDAFLRQNNLIFLGFEGSVDIQAYQRRFPADRAATDLVQWEIYENENPDTFLGMYQFWIQKAE